MREVMSQGPTTTQVMQRTAYSQTEAAERLGITQPTLRQWEKKGLLTSRRPNNGKRLYSVEEIERLAAGGGH